MRFSTFARESLIRKDFFGIDSIQGLLELATWYSPDSVQFCCNLSDKNSHDSMYFQLLQLEKEGYLNLEWEPYEEDKTVQLSKISLTTQGRKLLEELKAKSKSGRLKQRLINLFWVVVTSIITTLVVLKIKGI
ncbi:MAG: hypothetical protein ACYSSI_10035 [Planctomycetota bacterium]|jgi:hypothetical protein